MTEHKSSLAKNMTWNTVGNLVYCVCQWIMTILVVKLDSYDGAGYLSLAMTTSSTFSTIAMFSMRNFQVSDIQNEFRDSEYLGSRLITCISSIILCYVYSLGSTSNYQMFCINAFMLIRIAESIVDVIHGIDQKYDRYDLIGKSYLLRGIATDIAFISGLLVFNDILCAILITASS
jgi:O-antigen/teichoic acid export membrane protein